MIDFNVPPYLGTEMKYVEEAVARNHKICGDGPFTHRCNEWLETRSSCLPIRLCLRRTPLC